MFKEYCTSEVGYGGTCDYKWECKGALVCRDRKCVHKGGVKHLNALKSNGAPCMSNQECKNVCIKERCESRRRTGGICSRSDQCYGKLVCRNGKCQNKKGFGKWNGKKCKYDHECVNICLAGTCRNARFFGQTCFKSIHCKEELICVNSQCRSATYKGATRPTVAIPRPAKKPAVKPMRARKAASATQTPVKKPVQGSIPETKKTKLVKTKEGKTDGAQAAIQEAKEKKKKPTSKALLRSGEGYGDSSTTRSNVIKFFLCTVHKDECPK